MTSGVYQIKNVVNKHCYVGSSVNIDIRWSVHKHLLKNNKHYNQYLQNAWNKYKQDNFKFEILELITSLEQQE